MDRTPRQPRVEEEFALETICAVESVLSHRWLEAAAEPTPDLEVTLDGGMTVTAEITMSTDGSLRSLREEYDNKWWPVPKLNREWWVLLSDYHHNQYRRVRQVKELIDRLVDIFQSLESQEYEPDAMCSRANEVLTNFDQRDWDNISVAKCVSPVDTAGGGIRTWVVAIETAWIEATEELVQTVQERISSKIARGQLSGASSPKWLIVVMDRQPATMQLGAAFTPDGRLRYQSEIESITFAGVDEVWVIGPCFSRPTHRHVLRLFGSGAPMQWQIVDTHDDGSGVLR
ncbi:MAG: hypothetical protein OXH20_13945 [bacterium]|nr:hypothetical protein [bacterium]MDE0668176.1 hypothetical protein [bacterium]